MLLDYAHWAYLSRSYLSTTITPLSTGARVMTNILNLPGLRVLDLKELDAEFHLKEAYYDIYATWSGRKAFLKSWSRCSSRFRWRGAPGVRSS